MNNTNNNNRNHQEDGGDENDNSHHETSIRSSDDEMAIPSSFMQEKVTAAAAAADDDDDEPLIPLNEEEEEEDGMDKDNNILLLVEHPRKDDNNQKQQYQHQEEEEEMMMMKEVSLMEDDDDDDNNNNNNLLPDDGCFFADATLDLEEAHNMATDISVVTTDPQPIPTTILNSSATAATANTPLSNSNSLLDGLEMTEQQQQPSLSSSQPPPPPAMLSQVRPLMSISNKTMMMMDSSNNNNQQQQQQQRLSSAPLPTNRSTYRPRSPRRPRDVPWALAAVITIAIAFLAPHQHQHSATDTATAGWTAASSVVVTSGTSLFLSLVACIVLARLLYRHPGGGDGDDARHGAARFITNCQLASLIVFPLWALFIVMETPSVTIPWIWLPGIYFVRDIYIYRERIVAASPHSGNSSSSGIGIGSSSVMVFGMVDTNDGRRTFFKELVGMSLDILSRSLRRQSFYRTVNALLVLQFMLLLAWRHVLFITLQQQQNHHNYLILLIVIVGGKWATGILTRILGLIASGGITAWFAQQSILMDEMERMKKSNTNTPTNNNSSGGGSNDEEKEMDSASDEYDEEEDEDDNFGKHRAGNATAKAALHSMPKAYRNADAAAYKPIMDFDEGMDDDYDDDDYDDDNHNHNHHNQSSSSRFMIRKQDGKGMGVSSNSRTNHHHSSSAEWTGGGSGSGSTVKSFLICALTTSFGSVAQCALLGGLAQFLWGLTRNMDSLLAVLSRRQGFRGMRIGNTNISTSSSNSNNNLPSSEDAMERIKEHLLYLYKKCDVMAREFVRNHSDYAMSHVAAYFKSYQRAANDVLSLIDSSGVEPIIHDDITSHMCFGVCTVVAGMITLFESILLAKHRSLMLSDADLCEASLTSFLFSFFMVWTIMEPLRASIKAVYVCFAQHPQSLSQAYPLIFHRLSRISETILV